ncbi:MAG TPA: phosphatidate cytidylyltransferase [Solimonas sp.]|nr:phosphatidate cytidylyltransferase [Solimonas sp.]
MLAQRVVTALVLLLPLLGAIWFAPTGAVYALFSAAGLLMAWEWTGLMGWGPDARGRRWAYVALTGELLAAAWWLPQLEQALPWLLVTAAAWWAAATLLFPGFPANLQKHRPPPWLMGVLGLLLLLSTILALAYLHFGGPLRLLYFLFIVFAADTGAYLAGRNFGRHKLAPNISPGKTVEGALGGLMLVAAWALTAGVYVFEVHGWGIGVLLGLSLVVGVVSVVGDLTESMFKRMAGLKDSGNILPGHGGILDRVDSILAAAPVMVLGLLLTGL